MVQIAKTLPGLADGNILRYQALVKLLQQQQQQLQQQQHVPSI